MVATSLVGSQSGTATHRRVTRLRHYSPGLRSLHPSAYHGPPFQSRGRGEASFSRTVCSSTIRSNAGLRRPCVIPPLAVYSACVQHRIIFRARNGFPAGGPASGCQNRHPGSSNRVLRRSTGAALRFDSGSASYSYKWTESLVSVLPTWMPRRPKAISMMEETM